MSDPKSTSRNPSAPGRADSGITALQAASLRIADIAQAALSRRVICRHCQLPIHRWDDPWAVAAYGAPNGLTEVWVHTELLDIDCSGVYCPDRCGEQAAEPVLSNAPLAVHSGSTIEARP